MSRFHQIISQGSAVCMCLLLLSACGGDAVSQSADSSPVPDTQNPTVPSGLTAVPATTSRINLSWAAATDNIGVAGYRVYRNGAQISDITGTAHADLGLTPSTSYNYRVAAYDSAGNLSEQSSPVSATTLADTGTSDTAPPSTPSNLVAQSVTSRQVSLGWSASTDNTGVSGYRVFRDGVQVGNATGAAYIDSNLAPQTGYQYTVSAYDAAGNESQRSTALNVTTGTESTSCSDNAFTFLTFSDNYSGQEGGLRRVFNEMLSRDPNIRLLTSAGDTPSFQRVRGIVDAQLNDSTNCGATAFPWYPAAGNHDIEVQSDMNWWATNWAGDWQNDPSASPLARQLPGITNFRRGPLQVQTQAGTAAIDNGTIYSYDYKNVHMVFINNYEQDIISDPDAGAWDNNGDAVFDPALSQLDWLEDDLRRNTRPIVFVFGHVALKAPCYNYNPPNAYYNCFGPQPPGWSEHNSNFHTTKLAQILANYQVTAYFFGHDHVPSRSLVESSRDMVYERLYWDVANDYSGALGNPGEWAGYQGPGAVWQVNAGRVYTNGGSYVLTKISDSAVTFQLYYFTSNSTDSTILWDTWTVPVRQNNVLYVDAQIGSASCTNYDVATRSCGSGLLPAYRDLNAASGAANPGDTVLIRGATFTTRFTPQKSGSAGAPITFQNYPGETVTITLESGGMQPGIELTDRHYLVLNGINVDNALMWAQILNSTNNVFKNGRYTRARDTGSRGGFRLVGSDYNQIVNNVFEDGNDNLYLENSNRNRVEGNTLNLARHTLLVLACSSYNVIRANKLANTSQKGAEVFDCEGVVESLYDDTMQIVKFDSARRNLWEDNSFTATRASSNISDYNAIQYAGQEGIVRNNLFYDNLGGGLGLQVYNGEAEYNYGNRVYQNTFYANRCFGIWGGWPAGIRYENNVIVNNIIFGNRNCGNTGANDIQNNAPAANTFINNPTTDPSFLDAGSRFLRQSGGSPAINAGVFLTTVVGSGSGTQLPVADAAYFYDGMGIPGEVGDVIQLEGQTDRARIVAVNYATNTLTLDRALSWTAGQGVAQRYNGTAPDIGAYESP